MFNYNFEAYNDQYDFNLTLINVQEDEDGVFPTSVDVEMFDKDGELVFSGNDTELFKQYEICTTEFDDQRDASGFWDEYNDYIKEEKDEWLFDNAETFLR